MNTNSESWDKGEEQPPILSSWNQLYAVVFFHLVFLIVLFYLFTRLFNA